MKQFVCGIDPGSTGALCVIDTSRRVHLALPFDNLDDVGLANALRSAHKSFHDPVFVKEIFIPSYSNGNTSFTVGRLHGIIDLTLAELGARRIDVRAKEWQRELHPKDNPNLKAKYLSLLAAEELFPDAELRVKLKKKMSLHPHDGIVDALLIAAYGVNLLAKEIGAPSRR